MAKTVNDKILRTKSIEELNKLEIEIVRDYGLLYTTNNFLEEIRKQRDILYSYC